MDKTDQTKAYLTLVGGIERLAAIHFIKGKRDSDDILAFIEETKTLLFQVLIDGARLSFCDYEDCDVTVNRDGEMCEHHMNGGV